MQPGQKFNAGHWAAVIVVLALIAGFSAIYFLDTTGKKGSGLSADYNYDISDYTTIDPSLFLYQPVGAAIQTGFKLARAVAIAGGQLVVVGDKAVIVLDLAGKKSKDIPLDFEPTAVCVDAQNRILAAGGGVLAILDMQGAVLISWKLPAENAYITSIAAGREDIFAADAANGVVYRFDSAGKMLGKIGQKDPDKNIPGFVIPSMYFDIALAADGLLRVVDPGRHLIIAFTFDGDREWEWGLASPKLEGFSGCCNPVNFAIAPDGSFITAEKGLLRVKQYDSDGKFLGVVAGHEQLEWTGVMKICNTEAECQSKGFDVAVDEAGGVFVLDTTKSVIRKFVRQQK